MEKWYCLVKGDGGKYRRRWVEGKGEQPNTIDLVGDNKGGLCRERGGR